LQVNISYYTQRFVGPITITMVPHPQRVNEAIVKLRREIEKFDDPDYITDEQIERAKRMLIIEEKYSREKTSQLIHTVSFWWASASLDYFTSYPDKIKQVTRSDIQRYVRKYILNNHFVEGLMVPPALRPMLDTMRVIRDVQYIDHYRIEVPRGQAFDPKQHADVIGDVLFILKLNPDKQLMMQIHGPNAKDVAIGLGKAMSMEKTKLGLSDLRLGMNVTPSSGDRTVVTFSLRDKTDK